MKPSKFIDHTLLKATATERDIIALCNEAIEYDFASVCVNPTWVELASGLLKNSGVLTCTVVGFPLGASHPSVKAQETIQAIADGADEIDMVINIGHAKNGRFDLVEEDIKAVVNAANGVLVKVIIETCYLTNDEKVKACLAAKIANADFVKTSTGFGTGGATVDDVALMRETVGGTMGVKASGGVKTKEDFENMVKAGATRIGTSNGVALMQGKKSTENY